MVRKQIQTRIMWNLCASVFVFAVSLLAFYEFEIYNQSVDSATKIVNLIDTRYRREVSDFFQRSRSEFELFLENDKKELFNGDSPNMEGLETSLQQIGREAPFTELAYFYKSGKSAHSIPEPTLNLAVIKESLVSLEKPSYRWWKERKTFLFTRPLVLNNIYLGTLMGLLDLEPIQKILLEYRYMLASNDFKKASVYIKTPDSFLGENLKFGHFYSLRNRDRETIFEPTEAGYLTHRPISLPNGQSAFVGNIIPKLEVLNLVYESRLYSTFWTLLLFLFLIVLLYINVGRIIRPLKSVVYKIESSSDDIDRVAKENSNVSKELIDLIHEQSDSIEKTSSLMGDVSNTSSSNAQRSGDAKEVIQQADKMVRDGFHRMRQLSEQMEQLSQFSSDMTNILNAVKEITTQIDVVAINASIEAARAGEKGRDFAVVADEIAKLAHNSLEYSEEIATQISESKQIISSSMDSVSEGQELLKDLSTQVGEASQSMIRIAEDSRNQSESLQNLTRVLMAMDRQTARNRIAADRTGEHGTRLTSSARSLTDVSKTISELLGERE